MAAVAVYEQCPGAAEVLEARRVRGWTPTPSLLKDGPVVMGYAATMGLPEIT